MVSATASAQDAQRKQQSDQIHQLEDRIERLRLVNEAMWELLKETTGLTEEHLHHKVNLLDQMDGSVDGRRRERATECGCGAMVNARSEICVFCGTAAPLRSVFDRI